MLKFIKSLFTSNFQAEPKKFTELNLLKKIFTHNLSVSYKTYSWNATIIVVLSTEKGDITYEIEMDKEGLKNFLIVTYPSTPLHMIWDDESYEVANYFYNNSEDVKNIYNDLIKKCNNEYSQFLIRQETKRKIGAEQKVKDQEKVNEFRESF
jgi:hypothetical protein